MEWPSNNFQTAILNLIDFIPSNFLFETLPKNLQLSILHKDHLIDKGLNLKMLIDGMT